MNQSKSLEPTLSIKNKFSLPKIDNVSTKKLKEESREFPDLKNKILDKKKQTQLLKEKQKNYCRAVLDTNHLNMQCPLTSKKPSIQLPKVKCLEEKKEEMKRSNYAFFKKKQSLGKQYLKENKIKIEPESLIKKAKKVIKSISIIKNSENEGDKENKRGYKDLLKNQKMLLAMDKLSEKIDMLKKRKGGLLKNDWTKTLKALQEVDNSLLNNASFRLEPLKASINLKLSLINSVSDN